MITVLRPAASTIFSLLFQTHLGTVEHLSAAPGWPWQGLVQPWHPWDAALPLCKPSSPLPWHTHSILGSVSPPAALV